MSTIKSGKVHSIAGHKHGNRIGYVNEAFPPVTKSTKNTSAAISADIDR
jgi:hypothetical protein